MNFALQLASSASTSKASDTFTYSSLAPLLPYYLPFRLTTSFARSCILSRLDNVIKNGYLEIEDSDQTFCYGNRRAGCKVVRAKVINDSFWLRVFASADLGVSEAFILGDVQISCVKTLCDLWLDNLAAVDSFSSTLSNVYSMFSGLYNAFLGQTTRRAKLNAIASYDQSNELFHAFLSQEMMYSCALWDNTEGGPRGDLLPDADPLDLERAQQRKIHHVLKAARVKHGDRLLEFGSGWGGLSIAAALFYGCEVDTLTLSAEQKALAEERVKLNGLEGRVRVHLMDYRDIPAEWESAFDAFVSIEMLEHVGPKHYNTYFKLVDWALKSDNTTAVVTSSTFPEGRYTEYQAEDFMRRYMWPNSTLPSATALITAANSGSEGRFMMEKVENHGAHYPRTLREWGRRLESNLTSEVLIHRYPDLANIAAFDAFKRKWQYLFAYASSGFSKGYITCHMLTFRKNGVPQNCA